MGARLAFHEPTDKQGCRARLPGPNLHGNDVKRPEGVSSGPQFGLLSPSPEDRRRRWKVLGITPVLEAIAIAIMVWALMSMPSPPLVKTATEEVVYFHTVAPPAPVRQPPRLLERPVPPPPVAAKPILPRLRPEEIQKPVTAERLKIPKVSQPAIEFPKTLPAPKPAETFASVEAPKPAPRRQIAMVHTGDFNPGSMAKGTVKRPLREVQTGGFGVKTESPTTRRLTATPG